MGLINSIRDFFSKEQRSEYKLTDPYLGTLFGGAKVTTEDYALSLSAVNACVRVRNQAISSVPLVLYRKTKDGNSVHATEHPLYNLFKHQVNEDMTSLTWRELANTQLLLRGKHYSEIVYDKSGTVIGLYPLNPDNIQLQRNDNGSLEFKHIPSGNIIPRHRIFYLSGITFDGINPYTPLSLARETFSLAKNVEEYGISFFTNGVNPTGFIEVPESYSETAIQRFKKDLQGKYTGTSNSSRLLFLEHGAKYSRVSIAPEDAQFLQTRKFSAQEIARFFGVPPYMIGDLEKLSYNNIEQQGMDLIRFTFRPEAVRWEQFLNKTFLSPKEREQYYFEFDLDGFARGDMKTRADVNAIYHDRGIISANEIRTSMNLAPQEGGDQYVMPLNYTNKNNILAEYNQPLTNQTEQIEEEKSKTVEIETRSKNFSSIIDNHKPMIQRCITQITNTIVNEVDGKLEQHFNQRDKSSFNIWLDSFLNDYKRSIVDIYTPIVDTFSDSVIKHSALESSLPEADITPFKKSYIDNFSNRFIRKSKAIFEKYLEDGQSIDEVRKALEDYKTKTINDFTNEESVRGANSYRKALYRKAGVTLIKSVRNGSESCPICSSLDGKVIGIDQHFVSKGDDMEGSNGTFESKKNYSTPPYHSGCICTIQAIKE